MEFFDKVKKVALDVAAVSSKQGKKIYSITKLKVKIAEYQNSVNDLYKEIGFDAYKSYKSNISITDAIIKKLEKIDAIEEEIAKLRKNIEEIKASEEIGVEDVAVEDENAEEAIIIENTDFDEDEVEPIDPIE